MQARRPFLGQKRWIGLLLGAAVSGLVGGEAEAQERLPPPSLPPRPLPAPTWPYELPVRRLPGAPRHRNPAMMVAGIALTGIGVTSLPVSLALFYPRAHGMASTCPGCDVAGAVLLPLGAIVPPVIGVPLWLSGAKWPGSWSVAVVPAITPTSRAAAVQGSF